MKILNIYLTEIYNFMDRDGFFADSNIKKQDNTQSFINFAKNLGYPEFGLTDGMALKDFSYLPNSDLIDFNDLNPEILLMLPEPVVKFIQVQLPEFNYQIHITLAIKSFSVTSVDNFVNRTTQYLIYLNKSNAQNAIQRDYDFLDYSLDFLTRPSSFEMFLIFVERSSNENRQQWQLFLSELLDLSNKVEPLKKIAAQIIGSTTEYEYKDFLQLALMSVNFEKILDVKIIKSKLSNSASFIEINSNSVFFSVRDDDIRNLENYKKFKLIAPRMRVLFPEIYNITFSDKGFYKRKLMVISYSLLGEISKKTFTAVISSLLNISNQNMSADVFNDKFLKPVEALIQISGVFDKFYLNDMDDNILDKM